MPDPPGAPLNLTATAGDTEVTLEWQTPTTGGDPARYQYRHKKWGDTDFIEWQDIPGSDSTTTLYTITRLENGVAYSFDVRGVNRGGNGTVTSNFATPLPPLPAAPTNLTAKAGDKKATLNWDTPTSGAGGTPDEYAYRQSEDGGSTWGQWTNMTGSDTNTVSYEITELTNGTIYTFEILAGNLGGDSAPSNQATAMPVPPAPGPPQNLTATAGDALATLNWNPPTTGGPVENYQHRYSTDSGTNWTEWQDVAESDPTTVEYTVTGLTYGTEHTIELRATNLGGAGQPSNQATATPLKPGLSVEIDRTSEGLSLAHAGPGSYPKIVFKFNLPVETFRGYSQSIKITNGIDHKLYEHTDTDEPNDWILEIFPFSSGDITVSLVPDIACLSGGICSKEGDLLAQVPSTPYVIEYESRPKLIGAWIDGASGTDGEYEEDQVDAKVRFDKPVFVRDGTPTLDLSVDSENRTVTYSGGSGTRELVFSYTIDAGEAPATSISVVDDTLKLAGSTIATQKKTDAKLKFTGSPYVTKVTILSDYNEDGQWTHSDPDEAIKVDVEFSEPVMFFARSGTPTILINADGAEVEARYNSGRGSDTLRFEYDVEPTDGTLQDGTVNAVSIVPDSLANNGTAIRDFYIYHADLHHGGHGTVWELVPSYGEVSMYRLFDGYEATDGQIDFEVRLVEPVTRVVTVDYATSDDTATDGVDYTGVSGTLTFEIGSTKKVVTVHIIDDALQELSETIKLTLSNPVNATIRDTQTTGWILDDD